MKLNKTKLTGIMLAALFGVATQSTQTYGAILHQVTKTQTITKGASLINERLLINEGWRNINILKINLDEENVELRPIESGAGVERQNILQMVNNAGAIAGINSDFFDMATSNTPSLGPVISEGYLKHAYNSNYSSLGPNKYMGTFTIDTNNTPSMEYYGVSIRLNANGALVGAMGGYNNIPSSLSRPVILDSTYYKTTSTAIGKLKNTYTIVVEDDVVTYLSKQDEVVTIPENGYVIVIAQKDANKYYTQLPIGTVVELQKNLYLNDGITKEIENMKVGIGGGGLIMKDGNEYTGSAHKITPHSNDPRTVIATLKNSNEVLLITIDGRNKVIGMKHSDLVAFLKSYNVKDAMYFDGGGSTTLVSRNEAELEVKLQNSPSDGAMRKVINGLGVFTTSSTGDLSKLYLEATYDRTFVGESISFTLKGVDANDNPVTVDKQNTTMTVTGITGTFDGYTFTPETSGKALVVANCNGVEVAKEIYVSEKPVGIRIEPSNLQVAVNASKTVQIYGIDAEGYKLPIKTQNVTWSSDNNSITVKEGTILGGAKALGTVTAEYKGLTAKLGAIVGDTAVPLESFENTTAKWAGDTSTVSGKVEASKDVKYHGDKALKMTYTFKESNNKQVAYTVFNEPIKIPEDAMAINMWVNAKKQGHVAKIEIVDAAGKKFYLKLSDNLNFEGWKYLSVALPKEATLPAKVTKFYTYAGAVSKKVTTAVYIDHVSITRGFKDKQGITVRDDYRFDPWYKESLQAPTKDQYVINAVGNTKVESMVLSKETLANMGKQLSDQASMVLLTAKKNLELPITTPNYTYNNTYQTMDHSSTKVIMVGTDSGGIRATNPNVWLSIKKVMEGTTAKHIILVMSKNPLTQFDDIEEGKVLHQYLKEQKETKDKNIIVVYTDSTENEVRIEDGIRYIRTNGLNNATDNVTEGSFVKFKIVGESIYYTFEQFK